ncbi:hypothetical protein [Xanthobacter sp. VNH20]|uniref:portal protein n=1 Tax=Xanthobacter sp. VNH20 TaxID=3156616 RepID=UPI0032B56BE6
MAAATKTEEVDGLPVAKLRQRYEDFASTKSAEIEEQRTARHYYHGDQLTAEERRVLAKRRQPAVTNNRIARKINGTIGVLSRSRQDPKAYPRTPEHEDGAETATEVLRYAMDRVDWPTIDTATALTAAINGIGVVEVYLEQGDHGDPEIGLATVDADSWFYDPRSYRQDFSDAAYHGVVKWLDEDDVKRMFPEAADKVDSLMSGGWADSAQSRDREQRWVNTTERQVRVVEHWYLWRGEWRWCFYSGDIELMCGVSPFRDEKGKTVSRFIGFSANVDHDGDRYGFIRNLKSPQDEINARRSKALHTLNVRRVIADKGAVDNVEKARAEMARPDGWIEKNPGRELNADDAARQADLAGQLRFLEDAKNEIENQGFNPSLIGTGVQNMSGRAIDLQQQAGMAELGPFLNNYRGWKLRVYRMVWNAIQQYWTSERWLRVTDDEDLFRFIQLNALQVNEWGEPMIVNDLGSLDVDIVIEEGPDVIVSAQATEQVLAALAQNGVPVAPEMIIEMSDLPGRVKKKALAIQEKLRQPPQDPAAGIKQALEIEDAKAKIGKTRADALKSVAGATKDFATVLAPAPPLPQEYGGDQFGMPPPRLPMQQQPIGF